MLRGVTADCHSADVRLIFSDFFSADTFTFSEPLPYSSNTSNSTQPNPARLGRFKQHEQVGHEDQLHLQRWRPQCLCVRFGGRCLWTHLPRKQHLLHSGLANMCIKYVSKEPRFNNNLLPSKILSKSIWSWNTGDQVHNGNSCNKHLRLIPVENTFRFMRGRST